MLILLPLLGIFGNGLVAGVEASLSLGFKAIKLPRHPNPANCSVGNTTFAHGVTFKLDCKTQCVCENGRHACSTLCPNEQLPAPEDTISCRSPRLVEVPGHCCKMWLCENPTADVYATCHNSTTSGNWTACSRGCGLGTATRQTSTPHAGCHQLSNLRLCENRRCDGDHNEAATAAGSSVAAEEDNRRRSSSHSLTKRRKHHVEGHANSHSHTHHHHNREHQEPAHRIRKGHECRSIQRLGPARIRLGECVSRKLYRPKLCGRCHRGLKCCAPSVSTTIQVELLCPLNAVDPINYVQQRVLARQKQKKKDEDDDDDDDDVVEDEYEQEHSLEPEDGVDWTPEQQSAQLWDTVALEPIDQEFLQSHQIQIENKFIAVEWILKCECSKNHCNGDRSNISSNIPHDNMSNTNKYGYNNYKNHINEGQQKPVPRPRQMQRQRHNHENNGEPNEQTNNDDNDATADVANSNMDIDHNDIDNSSSEQQPDIIPYPLSVGETSWKTAKLRQKQQQQNEQKQHQQHWQHFT
ncbi:GL24913 [Drosophila persimilis]|uniref:GL24913 n=1 Tax=Drosophila persimilis TaxID=7234 RepID=B4GRL3_DROPE|nr:basic-leucine zipper transcription factor A [Drosophila persimilis]XP_026845528.1 basic-leucine zipper transcription factor A [Drosophila persimilis]EDW40398.1 GL24913 [Drosophila persimilis]